LAINGGAVKQDGNPVFKAKKQGQAKNSPAFRLTALLARYQGWPIITTKVLHRQTNALSKMLQKTAA
jgi:hypothetical protein